MDKEFTKELDHTYLILGDNRIDEDEYIIQMALRGSLPGILPLSIAAKNGKKTLRADVTACASITSRYKSVSLTGSDLRKILSSIRDTASRMPGLLMSVRDLYLDPECIFLSAGGDEVLLCYIPHISDSEPDSVHLLSEYLLKNTDHSDQAAVQMAYAFYDQVSSEGYTLSDVLAKLLQDNERNSSRKPGESAGDPSAAPSGHPAGRHTGMYASEGVDGWLSEDQSAYSANAGRSDGRSGYSANAGRSDGRSGYSANAGRSDGHSGYSANAGRSAGRSAYSANAGRSDGPARYGTGKQAARQPGKGQAGTAAGTAKRHGKNRSAARQIRKPAAGRHGNSRRSGHKRFGSSSSRRLLLCVLILVPAACILILVFHMDLTQIMGMGFLCMALIWIIHSSLEKRAGEGQNIWFDEEEERESDDRFYQSLREELYDSAFPDDSSPAHMGFQNPPAQGWMDRQDRSPQPHMDFQDRSPQPRMDFQDRSPQPRMDFQDPSAYGQASWNQPEPGGEQTTLLHSRKPVLVSLQKDLCPDITLDRDHLILGKSRKQSDVVLPGAAVSRKHARIERRMDGYYVTDLFSTNGTFLDGHRLESGQAVVLKNGAQLTLASLSYHVTIPEETNLQSA